MEEDAIKMYTDPKTGYWGKSKMMARYRKTLDKVYALQRHRETTAKERQKLMRHITAKYPFHSVQIDLGFLPKLKSPLNNNIIGFVVVIDVFSRYLFIETIKNRADLHIGLRSILERMKREFKRTPQNLTGDNEFRTHKLAQLANEYKFKWWYGDPGSKNRTGIVERVLRTIKNLIKRYITQNDTTKYIDVLPDLIYNYNHSYHRTIRTTPFKAITTNKTDIKPDNKIIGELPKGEHVRVLAPRNKLTNAKELGERNKFAKGDVAYYSKDVYEVTGRDRNQYVVKNTSNNKTSKKTFSRYELYKIPKQVIKGGTSQKPKKITSSNNYDKQIEENTRVNHNKKVLKKQGINLDNILDKKEREEAKNATIRHKYLIQSKLKDKKKERLDNIQQKLRRSTRIRKPPDRYVPPDNRPKPKPKKVKHKEKERVLPKNIKPKPILETHTYKPKNLRERHILRRKLRALRNKNK